LFFQKNKEFVQNGENLSQKKSLSLSGQALSHLPHIDWDYYSNL
jgi:hypothetical protein